MKNENEKIFLIKLGANIKQIRENHGISQEKLGLEIDLSKNQVGRIERGGNSTTATICKIAKALGKTPKELFDI